MSKNLVRISIFKLNFLKNYWIFRKFYFLNLLLKMPSFEWFKKKLEIKVFDSSSKIQPGILFGNLMEYGAYDQCLGIYHYQANGSIHGKYCTISLVPDENLLKIISGFNNITGDRFEKAKRTVLEGAHLTWSVCVPHSCIAEDILPHFTQTIKDLTEGLDVNVFLNDNQCVSSADKAVVEKWEYGPLSYVASIVLAVLIATLMDFIGYRKVEKQHWFVNSFSLRLNFARLLDTKTGPRELSCLHGIRSLSSAWVLYNHRFMVRMIYPVFNSFYLLEWSTNYYSMIMLGGSVSVDIFFMLSGLLLCYNFFDHMTKYGKINWLVLYISRYLRITIPLSVALTWNWVGLKHVASGPLGYQVVALESKNCDDYWWSLLLGIQSYVNPSKQCMVACWYLSAEWLLFLASPVIMYPLWKYASFGYLNYIMFYIGSIAVEFYACWKYELEAAMPLTVGILETKFIKDYYVTPHTRASTYILGLGFGYFLFKTKDKKIKLNKFIVILGWIFTSFLVTLPVFGIRPFNDGSHPYNRLESSIFMSFSRSAFTFGVCWIIFCCVHGYGGIINSILSWNGFKIMGRIAYGIYLFHYTLIHIQCGISRHTFYYTDWNVIQEFFSTMILMILIAITFTLFFESPFIKLQSLVKSKPGTILLGWIILTC